MAALNAVTVKDPAGNRKFDKAKSNGRIDPLIAMGMAVALPGRQVADAPFDAEALIA
jgi:phage terminase large subunit-like protein